MVCSFDNTEQNDQLKREEGMIVLARHSLDIVSICIVLTPNPFPVFVVRSKAKISLSEIKVSGEQQTYSMLAVVHSDGVVRVLSLVCERMKMGGKGSIVVLRGGAVEMEDSSFSELETKEGAVVWGQTSERIEVLNSNFTHCRGAEFGSVVRLTATDCVVVVSNCRFVECWTGVGMKMRSTGRGEGGGSVMIEMRGRKGGGHCAVDLSKSLFMKCVLENTDSSMDEGRFVGGSGFFVFGNGPRQRLDLSGMMVSDCSCPNVKMADGFDGGMIVWRTQPIHTDLRGIVVKNCIIGSVKLAN
ncbi:hypothetical protein BLNAU_9614 [Blattamonas nauphoetae]|uniref:Right handed beta helix domain-containing protein n=1 Tax=Blattamonas nauphoetae TaxID=2049346 RepID=A0ABQ9XV75_9EUKA|nr:hypothetical protein BLNAU_9614 [Blattamonas nauphoetae]